MLFEDKQYIANKIRLARKKAKLTQEELAEKIGITSKQISRIELATYMPSVPTFFKIIKVLQINFNEFGTDTYSNLDLNREEFIKLILSLPDNQLNYCLYTVKTMVNNFDILKYN